MHKTTISFRRSFYFNPPTDISPSTIPPIFAGDFRSYLDAFTANDLYIKFLDLPIKTATKTNGHRKILVGYDSTLNIRTADIFTCGTRMRSRSPENKGGVLRADAVIA